MLEAVVTEAAVPEVVVPEVAVLEAVVTEAAVPEVVVPEVAVLEAVVTEAAVPEVVVPEVAVLEAVVTEAAVPEVVVPEVAVLEAVVTEAAVPEVVLPEGGSAGGGGHGGGSAGSGSSGGNNAGGNGGNNAGGNSGNNAGGNGGNNAGGNGGNNHGSAGSGGNQGEAQAENQNQGSYSVSVGVPGSTVSPAGNGNQITINVQQAQSSGEKISQQNNAISLAKGPVAITVSTQSAPTVNNGQISAKIASISMQSSPVTARFAEKGRVSASFHAEMNRMPPDDAAIGISLAQPDTRTMTKVENTVNEKGYRLDAVAYTAQVEKTDLQDKTYIGPSVVTMSVAPSWVLNHGGLSNVKIVRLADDRTSQLLETQFSGIDTSINMVFTGTSPDGLSMFTLISVASQEVTVAPTAPP